MSAGAIHYEPFGIYAGKTASLDALADGAKVAVPNDATNEARALLLLEAQGLIKLKEGVGLSATKTDIVENLTEKRPEVVCDPTLLLTAEEWDKLLVEPKYKEKYILVYQLGINKEIVDFARRLHNKTGYRIVYIPFPLVGLLKCDCKITVGPAEWMGLFKNAEYVVSDSFHGVVFALIFNRKFFAKVNGHHMNRRVQQLLNLVKLTDRTMDDVSYEKLTEEIDFTYANEQIARFREHSMEQLRQMTSED